MPVSTYIWTPTLGSDVDLNLVNEWELLSGEVDFDFACSNLWVSPDASNLTIDLDEEWSTTPGVANFDFFCGDPPVGDTIFDGFITHYTGETSLLDFTTAPVIYIDSFHTGETGSADLEVFPFATLDPYSYTGETGSFGDFQTFQNFDPLAVTGETFLLDVTENPALTIDLPVITGETGDFDLQTTSAFYPKSYSGENVTFDLELYPQQNFEFGVYDGQIVDVTILFSQALGIFSGYSSETSSIQTIELDLNWEVWNGEFVEFDLATEDTLDVSAHTGETASLDIDDHPSEGIGQLRAYEGAVSEVVLATLVSVILVPKVISGGTGAFFGFSDQNAFFGDIDLNYIACCPSAAVDSDFSQIEMSYSPENSIRYDGDRSPVATFELRTAPRLVLSAYTGEYSYTAPVSPLGVFDFFNGEQSKFESVGEIGVRLCVGNFTPSGSNVIFEFSTPYNDQCDSYLGRTGESVLTFIEANHGLPQVAQTGETFNFTVTTVPIMLLTSLTGETAIVRNIEFAPIVSVGETLTIEFYVPPIEAATGESVNMDIKVEYEVAFGEVGCLDNEFVPSDDNGDPIVDDIRTVPVEADQYVHSIKGRCF